MKTSTRFLSVFLLLALLFVPMQSVSAKGLDDGPVIFGGSYTVSEGETVSGDLVLEGFFRSLLRRRSRRTLPPPPTARRSTRPEDDA